MRRTLLAFLFLCGIALGIPAAFTAKSVDADFFQRGDCNDDGNVNVSDVSCIGGGGPFACNDAADANDNGFLNSTSDANYLSAWLFSGGPALATPAPGTCGEDGTADQNLGCETYSSCGAS